MSRLKKSKRLQAVEKPLVNIKNGVAGAKPPTGSRGGSPTFSPARTPGVYAQRLCTMQSQQSIHSLSPRGKGFGDRDREFALSYKKQTFSTSWSRLQKNKRLISAISKDFLTLSV